MSPTLADEATPRTAEIDAPTWRDALAKATDAVPVAYERRRAVFRAACEAGLTLAQIAEATGMSKAGVHKIVGNQRAGADALDEPVGG